MTAGAAAIGSLASQGVQSRWYRQLEKPDIQPPAAVFPVAWTALYADIALTSAAVLSTRDERPAQDDPRRGYLPALTVNLMLNAGWTWCFFRLHNVKLSLVVAGALAASSADLARRAGRARPIFGVALIPYALWCTYATVLTGQIEQLND